MASQAARGVPTLGGGQWWTDRRYAHGFRVQRFVGARRGHHRTLDPNDRRIASGSLERCLQALPPVDGSGEYVVLLHGLGRRRSSLAGMDAFLTKEGHATIRLDYASTREGIDAHAASVQEVLTHLPQSRISFVTHSLGGIIARRVLADGWPSHLTPHRMVMLAPPSTSAHLARRLDSAPFQLLMGPSGRELARGVEVPPPPIPFAIVAGSLRDGRGINPLLSGDDDGIVCVEETRLTGCSEHRVVAALHTTIMNHPEARELSARFLAGG
ncbi:MAG: triacylglycerol lipase [Polyangiales bacterium]|jgi:triacylglycerol lipase